MGESRRPKLKTVVLLSGGLDSSANLAFCVEQDEPVLALTIDYGQRASKPEIRAAQALSKFYDVRHQTVQLPFLGALGGNALTDARRSLPEPGQSQLDDFGVTRKSAAAVWVPNRNGVMINVAAAFAESIGATQVVVGFNAEEAATFPDNTEDFQRRITDSLELSTANHVRVGCYTAKWDKSRIVSELRKLARPFPFESIWSCYESGDMPCGRCESCQRLARALNSAGAVR